ncbi:MAG: ATP-binding protein [Desulfobacterales bacterium]
MVIKHKEELMSSWYETRMKLIGFLFFNITLILLVILSVTTYMVNNLYIADQKRLTSLHELEYSSKMASIGRLAAGIAHEINNPLAIINEKAGLMKDLFTIKKEYANDPRLTGILDSILASVKRCATITKRLLAFARQPDVSAQSVRVEELVREVLSFTGKEAEYRSLYVAVDVAEDIPEIESDRSKLQQIFLNLINNSFAAMEAEDSLYISAQKEKNGRISISVCDTGCGIPASDLDRVFEPFFSTKTQKGGTGLGLSITYNLVREIGGTIDVHSTEGEGTTFVVTLPLKMKEKKENSL